MADEEEYHGLAQRVRITECPLKKLNGIYEHVEGESHNGRPSYILKRY